MAVESFKNVIIGSGEAGKFLAWGQSKLGEKSIVIERSMLGGACPNVACLPSKNVIHSAKMVALARRAAELGLVPQPGRTDMASVTRAKNVMHDGLMQLHRQIFQATGTALLMGHARFVEPKTVTVELVGGGTRTLYGERVFVATGSRATVPAIPGLADAQPLTHVEALNLQRLPEHLVILGGGYVGLEFAQAMRRFGSRVTVLQNAPQLLPREDPEVAEAVRQLMADEGITVILNTELASVSGRSGDHVKLLLRPVVAGRGAESVLEATDLLVSTGRTPNTDALDVQKAGIQLDARGFVVVNEKLETTAPGVWAMGDCAGSPQFTHASFDDYRIVAGNLAGKTHSTKNRLVPYVLFTDPELAHVGLSETEAKSKGVSYRVSTMPMAGVIRTRTHGETRGFMKALIGADDRILGFTAFGAEASEFLAAVQTAMLGGLPYTVLRDAIFTHPTASEGLTMLFASPPAAVKA